MDRAAIAPQGPAVARGHLAVRARYSIQTLWRVAGIILQGPQLLCSMKIMASSLGDFPETLRSPSILTTFW